MEEGSADGCRGGHTARAPTRPANTHTLIITGHHSLDPNVSMRNTSLCLQQQCPAEIVHLQPAGDSAAHPHTQALTLSG